MGIGDEIMATGEARRLQKIDLRPVVFLDKLGRARWHEVFENNPRLSRDLVPGVQISHNRSGNRPYIKMVSPQRFYWRDYSPPRGEFYFTELEERFGTAHAGALVVEPNFKFRDGGNKDWGFEKWQTVVEALPHLPWAQVGPPHTPVLRGARLIHTPTFRHAAAVLKHSRGYVGIEGGLHHAAACFGRKAVVVFGGFISPKQTGYEDHINLFGAAEPCGNRTPCQHCRNAMEKITPDEVIAAVKRATS